MSAPSLRILFNVVYELTLAAWLGASAYHALVVAPALGRMLPVPEASRLGRALRLRLFAWGSTCFALALPACLGVPLSYPEYRGPWVAIQAGLIVACILAMIAGGHPASPGVSNAEQPANPGLGTRDRRLIGAAMLAALTLLLGNAARPEPRSRGIVEPTPQERARRLAEPSRPTPATRIPGSLASPAEPRPDR